MENTTDNRKRKDRTGGIAVPVILLALALFLFALLSGNANPIIQTVQKVLN